jgi:hypothetical protein
MLMRASSDRANNQHARLPLFYARRTWQSTPLGGTPNHLANVYPGVYRWQKFVNKNIRAQPIGQSAAPSITDQARGEGERMAGRHDKPRPSCLFQANSLPVRHHATVSIAAVTGQ